MNATNAKAAKIAAVLLAGLCLIGSVASAQAESRLDRVQVESALEVSCETPRVPGQQEIGRLFETANFSQTYDLRTRLQHIVARACHSGADRVRFAINKKNEPSELRYVAFND